MLLIRFVIISAAKIHIYFDTTKQKQRKFCFYIKIICFRVIYILIRCKTRNRQTHPDRFKPGRWAHPRPDLSSCTPWATTPERHQGEQRPPHHRQRPRQTSHPRATTPRTTPRAHTDRHTITPPGFRIYDKPNLTASIPMGNSSAAAVS